jgi:hypothetical protein
MSAQGATIQVGRPVGMPTRLLALTVATVAAAGIAVAGVRLIAEDDSAARPAMHAGPADRGHAAAHPAIRERFGGPFATEMPVQRLYPDGFGTAAVAEMPVQRLYPDGFGTPADETTTISSGVRRKW